MSPRKTLTSCAEVIGTGSSENGGSLNSGPGQLGSSEKAARTDGARRSTEQGSRCHAALNITGEGGVTK